MLLPTELSFNVGPLRLTAYRLFLLGFAVPCASRVLGGKTRSPADWCMLALALWIPMVLAIHHDMETALQTGGIQALEFVGPYFIARASFRDAPILARFMRVLVVSVLLLLPFVAVETVTGIHVLKAAAAAIAGGSGLSGVIDQRYGLTRAFGPFDHPILLGVFAASVFPIALRAPWQRRPNLVAALPGVVGTVLAAMCSLSSGAIATLMTQGILIGWDRWTRGMVRRWSILAGLLVAGYVAIDFLSNRSGLAVILSYATFDQATAFGRVAIWQFGFYDNVMRSPVIGIGLNDWVRPSWIVASSVDNHWLLVMMVYGIPGFGLFAATLILGLRRAFVAARGGDSVTRDVAKAWAFSIAGMAVAASTVAFWNSSLVYFSFMLGAWGAFSRRPGTPTS